MRELVKLLPIGRTPMSERVFPVVYDRVIVALDLDSIQAAHRVVYELGDHVLWYKIGPALYFHSQFDAFFRFLKDLGKKVFLDAKLFDVPNTVQLTIESVAARGFDMITVHHDAVEAAVPVAHGTDLKILAVIRLTSMSAAEASPVAYRERVMELINGVYAPHGFICGGNSRVIPLIHERFPDKNLITVCPGIRMPDAPSDRHVEIATPVSAIANGADYIVVGRPILGQPTAADRLAMLDGIHKSMSAGAFLTQRQHRFEA